MNVAPQNLIAGTMYDILMNGKVRATGTFVRKMGGQGIMGDVYYTFLVNGAEQSYPSTIWQFREHNSTNTMGGARVSKSRRNRKARRNTRRSRNTRRHRRN
jgi:hypothetical protein